MLKAAQQIPARSAAWLAFFAAILACWAWLYWMSWSMGLDLVGSVRPGAMMPMEMMQDMARFWPLFLMWAVMMGAMMLPTLVPTLTSYEDLMVSADGTRPGWLGVLAGYSLVWVAVAAVITVLQLVLVQVGLIDRMGIARSSYTSAILLIVVGLYQFTWAKQVCHGVCHAPMHYFLGHWRTGWRGGVRMGAGLGLFCAGCCWGFMALGFVGGVMSLLWMGLATAIMVLEKLPQVAAYVTKPVGVVLVAAGIGQAAWSGGVFG